MHAAAAPPLSPLSLDLNLLALLDGAQARTRIVSAPSGSGVRPSRTSSKARQLHIGSFLPMCRSCLQFILRFATDQFSVAQRS
jgi:hypothetical protein